MTTLHRAPWVFPVGAPPIRDGALLVHDGRVRAVGTADAVLAEALHDGLPAAAVHEWTGVLIPGLVNAHSHLQYSDMAEVGRGRYRGFEDWSRAFQVVYERPGHDWAASAADGLATAVALGTTAVADIVTDEAAIGTLGRGRVRGIEYWELMGLLDADWAEHGRDLATARVAASGERAGLSPHAPYSVDTGVLQGVRRLSAELGVRRHMHLAESAVEDAYTLRGEGALAEQWRGWGYGGFRLLAAGGSGLRPVAYADRVGALGADCHIAHGIYVNAEDRAILRRAQTAVALCPRSNAVIGLDEAPVAAYLAEGNPIAVGTDSLSSSPSLDLLEDVAELAAIARRQDYAGPDLHARLLAAATAGGAFALGMHTGDDRIGELLPGAAADAVVLDVQGATAADALAAVVEAGAGRQVATIIGGAVRG